MTETETRNRHFKLWDYLSPSDLKGAGKEGQDMFGKGEEAKGTAEDTDKRASKKQKKGTAEDTDKRASNKQTEKKGTVECTGNLSAKNNKNGGGKPMKKRATKTRVKNTAQDTGNRSTPVAETKTSPAEVAFSPTLGRDLVIPPLQPQAQRLPDARPVQRQANILDGGVHAHDALTDSDEEPSDDDLMAFLCMMMLIGSPQFLHMPLPGYYY